MEIRLKIGEVIKIISFIPKAFHAKHLTVNLAGSSKPGDIKIYFSYGKTDLETRNFDDLAYIQFKADPEKSKFNFKPIYNSLDKAYDYCFIETDKPAAIGSELVLVYEGI
ncbi:hypothetical protein CNR22_19450 [Sphingobacteriaceae bacterium]|nr:hypothetical protein CNR22_19450 [Sphingobacteriaceae bacterium]